MTITNPEFKTYNPGKDGGYEIAKVRELFDDFLDNLKVYIHEGRALSIVKTKLEEASFHGIKAIAQRHNDLFDNSED